MKRNLTLRFKHPRFTLFFATLFVGAAFASSLLAAREAFLLAFVGASLAFSLPLLFTAPVGASQLRRAARRDDGGRVTILLVAALTTSVVFVAVGAELAHAGRETGSIALSLASLFSAWLFANMVWALHYARLFYDDMGNADHGGLLFPGTTDPALSDFVYFALTLGMTFQVSDVQITSAKLRRAATTHGLLAFTYNVGIVALSVGIVGSALTRS